jgi:hypothetical protein
MRVALKRGMFVSKHVPIDLRNWWFQNFQKCMIHVNFPGGFQIKQNPTKLFNFSVFFPNKSKIDQIFKTG